jgi:hypothetical protein
VRDNGEFTPLDTFAEAWRVPEQSVTDGLDVNVLPQESMGWLYGQLPGLAISHKSPRSGVGGTMHNDFGTSSP